MLILIPEQLHAFHLFVVGWLLTTSAFVLGNRAYALCTDEPISDNMAAEGTFSTPIKYLSADQKTPVAPNSDDSDEEDASTTPSVKSKKDPGEGSSGAVRELFREDGTSSNEVEKETQRAPAEELGELRKLQAELIECKLRAELDDHNRRKAQCEHEEQQRRMAEELLK
eukprot:scaffold251308_cov27-Tisochrysis_lutea.AAC.1